MGVFGSRLNTVFLVRTFGCFQFPFFFGRSCLLWVRQLPSHSRHGCFRFPGGRAQRLPARCIADSDDGGNLKKKLEGGWGARWAILARCSCDFLLFLLLLLLLLLLFIVVLDFVDGTGAGGVGAVRGGNLKK